MLFKCVDDMGIAGRKEHVDWLIGRVDCVFGKMKCDYDAFHRLRCPPTPQCRWRAGARPGRIHRRADPRRARRR
eukprot:8751071-Pyramimonas_sp.AAC.1